MKKFAVVAMVTMFMLVSFSSIALAHGEVCVTSNGTTQILANGQFHGSPAFNGMLMAIEHSPAIDRCPAD